MTNNKFKKNERDITLAGIGSLDLLTLIKIWWYAHRRYKSLERRAYYSNRIDRCRFYETISGDAAQIGNSLLKAALEDHWTMNKLDSIAVQSLSDKLEFLCDKYDKLALDTQNGKT